ncbi:MAG: hypothetical protein PVH30_02045 [Desulfobacterales bacterium]
MPHARQKVPRVDEHVIHAGHVKDAFDVFNGINALDLQNDSRIVVRGGDGLLKAGSQSLSLGNPHTSR